MRRYPACTRKSQTRLVLFTSIFTRSRASRRRNLPPRRAYSRTSVSLITKYGLGRMRSDEQRVCSAGVRRCRDGLFARLRGAAIDQGSAEVGRKRITQVDHVRGLRPDDPEAPVWSTLLRSTSTPPFRRDASGPRDWRALAARSCWSRSDEKWSRDIFAFA
jgi:hypothetical protein